ncbi:phage antirepressor KilAC domain-containing protein [Clostridium sp. MSJ-8]|uniref:phage antirepressor n=1 Tax=Clostridium sp. MSJ-8 TaxID=2841510 RepID=UPI001C0EF04B|nr:phage antirepressor KilAC domain-containing protein [Clostridium sp. MSJ-8]MBU5486990.1 phage antirepressor KilAC domain-containing protein [Clostridium sp. MSJ-8]
MNNQIEIFKSEEFGEVRTLVINNEPYFVGRDVAEILGYDKAYSDVIKQHCDEEDYYLLDKTHHQNGVELDYKQLGQRGGYLINESGLYSLILSSKLPTAKKFKRWVTSEVLPSIRKHGTYMTEDTLEKALTSPDFLIKLATELKTEKEQRQALEEEKKVNAPKVIFADAVSTSKTSILVGELAKILKQNGVQTGQNKLFAWLRDNKYLIKRSGNDYNMPTQKSMELGLFEIKETSITHSDGHVTVTKTPKVTGKGQQYFINKFLNK